MFQGKQFFFPFGNKASDSFRGGGCALCSYSRALLDTDVPCLFVRRLGCQHGPAEARRCRRHGDGGAGHAARHDEIGDNGCEMAICFAPVVIRVATLLTVFFSSCDRRSECMYFSLFFPLS